MRWVPKSGRLRKNSQTIPAPGTASASTAEQALCNSLFWPPGVSEGDEVIVPAMTFIATAMAVTYIGAKPVCVDVDQFCTMNPEAIQSSITPKTKAIVPVHLYGQPADMDAIITIAEKNALIVVEDAAQAHGAVYKNRRCGSLATAAAWSFYPGKISGRSERAGRLPPTIRRLPKSVQCCANGDNAQRAARRQRV